MTVEDIRKRALSSIPDNVFSENQSAIEGMISNAKQSIKTYIDRDWNKQAYRQYMEEEDWEEFGDKFKFIPAITPVVQADVTHGKSYFLSDTPLTEVEYEAGFEETPEDIKNVIYTLTIYEINRSLGNTYNLSVKTVVTGSTTSNITKAPEDFYRDELKRLDKYKSKSHYSTIIEND